MNENIEAIYRNWSGILADWCAAIRCVGGGEPAARGLGLTGGEPGGGRRAPAPAPVKVAAAVAETSTTANASDQLDVKTQSEPESAELPSGRTRRRRSAAA